MDKVTGQCPQTTSFLKRKECRSGIEPRSFNMVLNVYRNRIPETGQALSFITPRTGQSLAGSVRLERRGGGTQGP